MAKTRWGTIKHAVLDRLVKFGLVRAASRIIPGVWLGKLVIVDHDSAHGLQFLLSVIAIHWVVDGVIDLFANPVKQAEKIEQRIQDRQRAL